MFLNIQIDLLILKTYYEPVSVAQRANAHTSHSALLGLTGW